MKLIEKILAVIFLLVAVGVWIIVLNVGGGTRIREVDNAVAITKGGNPIRGYHAIQMFGCGACHTIPGVPGATGKVGPSLEEFRERPLIAGELTNTAEHLVQWIRHPREIDSKTAMPELGVSEEEARDIAAYLYALRTRF
ncbi:MAG: c-type cytochrome [Bacteriovoracaceae bacterium]